MTSKGESEVREIVLSRGQECEGRSLKGGEIKVGRSILNGWVTGQGEKKRRRRSLVTGRCLKVLVGGQEIQKEVIGRSQSMKGILGSQRDVNGASSIRDTPPFPLQFYLLMIQISVKSSPLPGRLPQPPESLLPIKGISNCSSETLVKIELLYIFM